MKAMQNDIQCNLESTLMVKEVGTESFSSPTLLHPSSYCWSSGHKPCIDKSPEPCSLHIKLTLKAPKPAKNR